MCIQEFLRALVTNFLSDLQIQNVGASMVDKILKKFKFFEEGIGIQGFLGSLITLRIFFQICRFEIANPIWQIKF